MSDFEADNLPVPFAPSALPDAHGEAALLLTESLIHTLRASAHLTIDEANDVVQTAIDVQIAYADDRGEDPNIEPLARRLLSAISDTLRIDGVQKSGRQS